MTADWSHLPYDLLARISTRIINEVQGVNRVVYDISSQAAGDDRVGVGAVVGWSVDGMGCGRRLRRRSDRPRRKRGGIMAKPSGMVQAVCIFAIVLGVIGVWIGLWGVVNLATGGRVQDAIASVGGAGVTPEQAEMQRQLYRDTQDAAARLEHRHHALVHSRDRRVRSG